MLDKQETKHDFYSKCWEYIHQPVRVQTKEGLVYEGVIEHVDQNHVYLLIEDNHGTMNVRETQEKSRQFFGYGYGNPYYTYGYPGYGYGGFAGYPGYYYGYPRRFSRLVLPLAALTALALLPYY